MKVHCLGSGSSGNSLLITEGETSILVDCGVGARRTRKFLQEQGIDGKLSGLLISHEHGDHIRALPSILRYQRCGIFATAGTYNAIGKAGDCTTVTAGLQFTTGALRITAVGVSHDGEEPVGFIIEGRSSTAAIFTDLGLPNADVHDAISAADLVVLESNYCPVMLESSAYPVRVKQRIRGPLGHLSNEDSAALLASALTEKARHVWLAHLSDNNNTPDLAQAVAMESIGLKGLPVQPKPLPRYEPALLLDEAN